MLLPVDLSKATTTRIILALHRHIIKRLSMYRLVIQLEAQLHSAEGLSAMSEEGTVTKLHKCTREK